MYKFFPSINYVGKTLNACVFRLLQGVKYSTNLHYRRDEGAVKPIKLFLNFFTLSVNNEQIS